MPDWSACPAIECHPRKIGGAWAFTGTRVPVYALFENLESGATVKEFLDWYPEVESWQVESVLKHATDFFKAVD
ncbi:MAG: DUF433 domain-containing protein [Gammaproteobacteria bacterium]|nr:DUF433 domain-containing protein [Gammaproteobacteria bacterium]MYD80576.1 DUF433 domain-containing protein [Gammaproteobacteria bacterium]